jgi:hypothetical protein
MTSAPTATPARTDKDRKTRNHVRQLATGSCPRHEGLAFCPGSRQYADSVRPEGSRSCSRRSQALRWLLLATVAVSGGAAFLPACRFVRAGAEHGPPNQVMSTPISALI